MIIICVKIENTDTMNSEGEKKGDYRCALHEYILLEWGNEEESTRIKRRLRVVTFAYFFGCTQLGAG
jgi:hypothetical protein